MSLRDLLGTTAIATTIFLGGYWAGSPKTIEKNFQKINIFGNLEITPNIDLPQPIKQILGINHHYKGNIRGYTETEPFD